MNELVLFGLLFMWYLWRSPVGCKKKRNLFVGYSARENANYLLSSNRLSKLASLQQWCQNLLHFRINHIFDLRTFIGILSSLSVWRIDWWKISLEHIFFFWIRIHEICVNVTENSTSPYILNQWMHFIRKVTALATWFVFNLLYAWKLSFTKSLRKGCCTHLTSVVKKMYHIAIFFEILLLNLDWTKHDSNSLQVSNFNIIIENKKIALLSRNTFLLYILSRRL